MSFPKAQDMPIIHWFFQYLKRETGQTKSMYVYWMNNPNPELHFIPALLKSELFPDKLWFAMQFDKEGKDNYFGAKEAFKKIGTVTQDVLGKSTNFKLYDTDSKWYFLIFVADYPHKIDTSAFVKILLCSPDEAQYN